VDARAWWKKRQGRAVERRGRMKGAAILSRTNINMYQHKREALEIKRRKQNYTNTYGADGT
jgi:hypothetical protein